MAQLRQREIEAAQSAEAHEEALTRLDTQLAALSKEAEAKTAALARRRREQTELLAALLRLSRNPPSGLVFAEGRPVDLLRGGILMGAALPPLVKRAKRLGIELQQLADLRGQIQDAEARHRIESDALTKEETRIQTLIAQKAALQAKAAQGAAASAQRVEALAAQARNLRDLIARADAAERRREVEEAKKAAKEKEERVAVARPPSIRPFSEARGRMLYPSVGKVVIAFGVSEPAGPSQGLTIETRPGAPVVAPFDGRVVFAGPFKGYGQILIIRHGPRYHSLLAGLGRIDSSVGQWLVAGEPVGTMPAGEAKPRLYLELRHDGRPINPLPWLATRDAKVKG